MGVITGLDALIGGGFAAIRGKKIGLVCNQATITSTYVHVLDAMLPSHRAGLFEISRVFGPQHGLWGHTQDNMIEWEGYVDSRTSLPFHSLYGRHREPKAEWLAGLDVLVIDLPDIGSRYYTFIWTMALCIKACEAMGIEVLVLDRPNPIGGTQVEGTVGTLEYASFVGLYPVPMRHGMTLGEIATYLQSSYFPNCHLRVLRIENWQRNEFQSATGLPWAMPSPNMPSLDTAIVYPGACLLEGTNLSEGRGTTRPFEIVGAPYLDAWQFADHLCSQNLPGVVFRPICFQPTFQKHAGCLCSGVFVHVTNVDVFEPVLTYVAILQAAWNLGGSAFQWTAPPYEYEEVLLPIDILAGTNWLRNAIEVEIALPDVKGRFEVEVNAFEALREPSLLY